MEKKGRQFRFLESIKPVDPKHLENYEKQMKLAISRIVQNVERRRLLAAESRQRRLEMPDGTPTDA